MDDDILGRDDPDIGSCGVLREDCGCGFGVDLVGVGELEEGCGGGGGIIWDRCVVGTV